MVFFFFQAEDGIRDGRVTGVQTCALPICYVKVLRSLLVNDGKLLRPETVQKMFENHIGPEAEEGFRAAMESPGGVFFRVGMDPGTKLGHGLGGRSEERRVGKEGGSRCVQQ